MIVGLRSYEIRVAVGVVKDGLVAVTEGMLKEGVRVGFTAGA